MDYEAIIEDEEVFTRPWKIKMKLYKKVGDEIEVVLIRDIENIIKNLEKEQIMIQVQNQLNNDDEPDEEAEEIKAKLEAAGAKVELK